MHLTLSKAFNWLINAAVDGWLRVVETYYKALEFAVNSLSGKTT